MDFSFVELILSTFLGFGSALLVEAIIEKHKDNSLKKQLLLDLRKELLSLKSNISTMQTDKAYIRPYSIPIWSGAKDCGSLLCMDKSPCYTALLETFSSIEEANLVEMKCFELLITQYSSENKKMIISILLNSRKHISEQIEIGLRAIKGELT